MQRKSPSRYPGLRASLLWGVGPSFSAKASLHSNREAFSLGARPHLPGDWRTPLCRAPTARSSDHLCWVTPPSCRLCGSQTRAHAEIMTVHAAAFLFSGMARGLLWCLSFPPSTESVETTEMREELGPSAAT